MSIKSRGKKEKSHLNVFVRCRPPHPFEDKTATVSFLNDQEITVNEETQKVNYTFDHVFSPIATNKEVFNVVGEPLVISGVSGINASLMAYGQTSTGKTQSMLSEPDGMISLAIQRLFEMIEACSKYSYKVTLSFLQIYQDKIYDLLPNENKGSLNLREHPNEGVIIEGIFEEIVINSIQAERLLGFGKQRLVVTEKNQHFQNRSHSICILKIEKTKKQTQKETLEHKMDKILNPSKSGKMKAKLFLCDLAGSERLRESGISRRQLEETRYINTSLLELGNVIHALTSRSRLYVPFRNSTLTRLLKESLGGNSKTSLMVCISPSPNDLLETKYSLNFGQRAMKVVKHTMENVEPRTDTHWLNYPLFKRRKNRKIDYRALAEYLTNKLKELESAYNQEKENLRRLKYKLSSKRSMGINSSGSSESESSETTPCRRFPATKKLSIVKEESSRNSSQLSQNFILDNPNLTLDVPCDTTNGGQAKTTLQPSQDNLNQKDSPKPMSQNKNIATQTVILNNDTVASQTSFINLTTLGDKKVKMDKCMNTSVQSLPEINSFKNSKNNKYGINETNAASITSLDRQQNNGTSTRLASKSVNTSTISMVDSSMQTPVELENNLILDSIAHLNVDNRESLDDPDYSNNDSDNLLNRDTGNSNSNSTIENINGENVMAHNLKLDCNNNNICHHNTSNCNSINNNNKNTNNNSRNITIDSIDVIMSCVQDNNITNQLENEGNNKEHGWEIITNQPNSHSEGNYVVNELSVNTENNQCKVIADFNAFSSQIVCETVFGSKPDDNEGNEATNETDDRIENGNNLDKKKDDLIRFSIALEQDHENVIDPIDIYAIANTKTVSEISISSEYTSPFQRLDLTSCQFEQYNRDITETTCGAKSEEAHISTFHMQDSTCETITAFEELDLVDGELVQFDQEVVLKEAKVLASPGNKDFSSIRNIDQSSQQHKGLGHENKNVEDLHQAGDNKSKMLNQAYQKNSSILRQDYSNNSLDLHHTYQNKSMELSPVSSYPYESIESETEDIYIEDTRYAKKTLRKVQHRYSFLLQQLNDLTRELCTVEDDDNDTEIVGTPEGECYDIVMKFKTELEEELEKTKKKIQMSKRENIEINDIGTISESSLAAKRVERRRKCLQGSNFLMQGIEMGGSCDSMITPSGTFEEDYVMWSRKQEIDGEAVIETPKHCTQYVELDKEDDELDKEDDEIILVTEQTLIALDPNVSDLSNGVFENKVPAATVIGQQQNHQQSKQNQSQEQLNRHTPISNITNTNPDEKEKSFHKQRKLTMAAIENAEIKKELLLTKLEKLRLEAVLSCVLIDTESTDMTKEFQQLSKRSKRCLTSSSKSTLASTTSCAHLPSLSSPASTFKAFPSPIKKYKYKDRFYVPPEHMANEVRSIGQQSFSNASSSVTRSVQTEKNVVDWLNAETIKQQQQQHEEASCQSSSDFDVSSMSDLGSPFLTQRLSPCGQDKSPYNGKDFVHDMDFDDIDNLLIRYKKKKSSSFSSLLCFKFLRNRKHKMRTSDHRGDDIQLTELE